MEIIFSTSTSPTFNIASEELLLTERQDEILFLYVNEPSVVIGCNQAIKNEVNLEYCAEHNIQVVRRMSGGGAVYHDFGNLNYCFISNRSAEKSSLDDEFLKPIVSVLKTMGLPVEIGKRKDLWLEGNYKISGTAAHVTKNRALHHGTLLYSSNLEMLEMALSPQKSDSSVKAIPSVRSKVMNLNRFMQETNRRADTSSVFFDFFVQQLGVYFQQNTYSTLSDTEVARISELSTIKYATTAWTFKK